VFPFLITLIFAGISPGAEPERPRRVLMVHSFGSSAPPFTTHSTAFEATLKREMGTQVDLDEVSLDMARYAQPDMEDAFAEFLEKRISKWQPDLVVPIGSPAGRFVAKFRDRLFPGTPVVYSGMDRRTLPQDAGEKNATFVGESFDLTGLVEDILQLDPQTNNIVVIFGASPLERYWTDAFRQAFQPFSGRVQFTWVNELSFDQMLDLVSKLPPHSFVLLGLLIRDASGVTYNEDDALQRLHAVSRAPINGLYQHEVGLGIVGGRLYQGELEGIESAQVAVRILRGEQASAIPTNIIGTREPLYDWRELRRWRIPESRLPAGSVVQFRQPTAWERYRWWAMGALALFSLQSATIIALMVQHRRRRRAQEELRESRQLMELAAGAGGMGLWSRGSSDGDVWLSGSMRSLFGFADGTAVSFHDIVARVHPDDRPRMVAELERAHADDLPFEGEYRLLLKDGAERWVLAKGRTVVRSAGGAHRMGVILDVTERKLAEAELRLNRDELAHVSRVTTMGELAASLAHELNQPLAAILCNAQAAQRYLARSPSNVDEVSDILVDIVADNGRATEIIKRMRAIAKKEVPEFHPLDLGEAVDEVVLLVHGDVASRRVHVAVDIDPQLPQVRGVKVQVQQVLLNLLLNAMTAVKEFPRERRNVAVCAAPDGAGLVRVTVKDSGPGLAPELMENIFKPFFTTKRDGLGMGLPISRSIVESHGGRLWAEPNPGEPGATFCFTIPSVPQAERTADVAEALQIAD
jgi:PAS domain S-box-containing protein